MFVRPAAQSNAIELFIRQKGPAAMNSTPFVRQYGILNNKWGVKLCQERKGIKNTRQNSKSR